MHLFCRRMTIPRRGQRDLVITAPLTGHMADTWRLFSFDRDISPEWPELP
jgi:hypothetical protein